ncbi:MAG TPA: ABC transporter permease [Mesorhizobium sp.]|jgi:simple sugar transport system permease protein|uniref:ABC transporter permease n=1 Tax=Mesorhizobium sp. TaxID=1871066 RepID=UPI002DDD5D72|nr:ABC transporter permease [Mesorhizobium sp.]HEV2501814.1 ABC transporter permease [Mesorhizobium sp.]
MLLAPIIAVAAAMVVSGILIASAGVNPIQAFGTMIKAAVGSRSAFLETLLKVTPLIFTGLCAALAFRIKFWNIGGEGQLLLGAMAAAYVGTQTLPAWSYLPLMIAAGFLLGGLGALLPAWLRLKLNVNDTVSTLMLNFVIFFGMMALLSGPWKDPISGWSDSPDIVMNAEFPIIVERSRLHIGFLLAVGSAVVLWLVSTRTTFGMAMKAIGENPRAAHHAGFSVSKIFLVTALLSGGLAGLAGVCEVGGVQFQVISTISPGYGYAGLVVATLARLHPGEIILSAMFLGAIMTGADEMSRQTGIPATLADVVQGVSLLAMLIALVFTRYRLRLRASNKKVEAL